MIRLVPEFSIVPKAIPVDTSNPVTAQGGVAAPSNTDTVVDQSGTQIEIDTDTIVNVGGVPIPALATVATDQTSIAGSGSAYDPLHAITGGVAVDVDGVTITGDGTASAPLAVLPLGLTDKVPVLTDGITIVGDGTTLLPLTVITGGGGGAIVADEVTLTGFGTVLVPVAIKQVEHNGTLSGAGTVASPLATVTGAVAVDTDGVTMQGDGTAGSKIAIKQVEHNGTLTGTGTLASPLSTVTGAVAVDADNVTLQGDGTAGSPLAIKQVEHDATLTGAGTLGSPLGTVTGAVAVDTDNVTLQGDGTAGSTIRIKQVEHNGQLAGAGTVASPLSVVADTVPVAVDGVTITGDGTTGSPLATVSPLLALSVKNYGAVGNGVADDRAAIQSAVNAAIAAGLDLFFPPGTYKISAYIDVYGALSITIYGCRATIVYPSDNAAVVADAIANTNAKARSAFYARYCRNLSFGHGLTFKGGAAQEFTALNVGSGIYASRCFGLTVYGCTAQQGAALLAQDATNGTASLGDSLGFAAGVGTLTDASALFTPGHVGAHLHLSGCTNDVNNDVYIVTAYVSTTQIQFNSAAGINEATATMWWSIDDDDRATTVDHCISFWCRGTMTSGKDSTIRSSLFEQPNTPDATGLGDGYSISGTTVTLTDNAGPFLPQHQGKYVVTAGSTSPANNITAQLTYISATQISYTNAAGVTEPYAGAWWIPNGDKVGLGGGGAGALTIAGTTMTLTSAVAAFAAGDVGSAIRINKPTNAGNLGGFVITSFISSTQITFENALGVTEAYAGVWTLDSYDRVGSSTYGSSQAIYLFADRTGVVVDKCTFRFIRVTCVKASGSASPLRGIRVTNCTAVECAVGIEMGADDVNEHSDILIANNEWRDCGTQRFGWNAGTMMQILGTRNVAVINNQFLYTRNAIGSVDGIGTAGQIAISIARYIAGVSQPVEQFTCTGNQFAASPGSTSQVIIQTAILATGIGTRTRYSTNTATLTKSGTTMTLTDSTALFSAAEMVGQTIQLVNATGGGNNVTATILSVPTKTTLTYTNAGGTGGGVSAGTYRIQSTKRGGGVVIANNTIMHCATIGIFLTDNTGSEVHDNVFAGLVHDVKVIGDAAPRIYGNRELGRNTSSGGLWIQPGTAWPVIYDNTITNQAIGPVPAHAMDISVDGTLTVDYPLLGRTVRMRPTNAQEEVVVAYGDQLVDGDTIVVDGNTFTFKQTAPGANQFNTFAGLVALIAALAGYTCQDYGTGLAGGDIDTHHLWIRKTAQTTADGTFTVTVSALNSTALVLLRNNTAATACLSRGSGSAGPTPDKLVAWSPMNRASGGVIVWASNTAAKTLLAQGSPSTGVITCVAKASFSGADTDFMTIGDGMLPAVAYGFSVTGGAIAGKVTVNISGATSAADVAALLRTAILANQPGLGVVDNLDGTLSITHHWYGTAGNVTMTENVANAGFLVTGLSGGSIGSYLNTINTDDSACCRVIQTGNSALATGAEFRGMIN